MSELSRLYDTAEMLDVSYQEQMVVRLRGKEEVVTKALSSSAREL
jgi:hypothetical protein